MQSPIKTNGAIIVVISVRFCWLCRLKGLSVLENVTAFKGEAGQVKADSTNTVFNQCHLKLLKCETLQNGGKLCASNPLCSFKVFKWQDSKE